MIVARYIPGGRTACTVTMGAVAYPRRSFAFFDAIAAATWALYCSLIGFIGGAAFENDPIKGLLLGPGLAVTITVAVEVVRHGQRRRKRFDEPEPTSRRAIGRAGWLCEELSAPAVR